MVKRLSLPLLKELSTSSSVPTVEQLRERLGGRLVDASELPPPGRVVQLQAGDERRLGVVLFTLRGRTDVLFERGLVRRTTSDQLFPALGSTPEPLQKLSDSVQRFAAMREGDELLVLPPGETAGNEVACVLREKCRFGALVERADGGLLGVGFERVAPVQTPS
jgi:hypothetical protein